MFLVNNLILLYNAIVYHLNALRGYYCALVNPTGNFEYKSNAGSTGNHTYKYG